VCSFVVLFASIVECESARTKHCQGEYGFAITMSSISLFFAILYVACLHSMLRTAVSDAGSADHESLIDTRKQLTRAICFVFILIWTLSAGVCTFDKPFVATGNGYFAAWGGLISSICFAMEMGHIPFFEAAPHGATGEDSTTSEPQDAELFIDQMMPGSGSSSEPYCCPNCASSDPNHECPYA
jgi:hypothetical protein